VIPTAQVSSFTLQYFPYYVWCSKYSCLCSESIGSFPGTASKFFLKLLVTILVAPIITGIIVHFRFHIRCIFIHKLLYFNLLLLLLLLLLFLTEIELSLFGSSPYASTDKTNKNKYISTKQYKKHSTNNTKHSK